MLAPSRFSLRARALVLLGICLLALSALPPGAAQAAFKQNTIDNSIADFGRGQFQRAALGSLQNTAASPKLPDLPGTVQLGPIGILRGWLETAFPLKKPLIRMGATAIGNRIYVIGGTTPVGSAQESVADVWSAAVSTTDGTFLEDWQAETSLPPVQNAAPPFNQPVAAINSAAVTSVATSGGAGYIYVIGGSFPAGVEFSSYAVRIGTVGANGHISSWATGPSLPGPNVNTPTFKQNGIQSAVATSFTVGGNTYVYVIGGLSRYRVGSGGNIQDISEGLKTVYYARVSSGGQLVRPSNGQAGWDRLDDIPLIDPTNSTVAGLWDATVMADHFVVSTGVSHDVLYVVGGQVTPDTQTSSPTYSSIAYRAFIKSDGTLDWGDWTGTMVETRRGLSGVPFRGHLYAVGGIPSSGNEPDQGVLTSYVEDDLTLHQFNTVPPGVIGGGSNFLKSDALPTNRPRTFQGMAIVPAGATSTSSAFVYVMGGRGSTTDGFTGDDNGTTSVIYGKIGGSEDVATTGYADSGWYYSKPFEINFTGAQLQEINWATVIDRSAAAPDIQIDYRVTSANTCATADWTDNSWVPLDGSPGDSYGSVSGQNTAAVANLAARCFQYRAKLTTTDYHITPSLLNLSIKIFVPGNPDLSVQSLSDMRGPKNPLTGKSAFIGLSVVIKNSAQPPGPTLAADVDGGGSFFVDLCILGPNAGVPQQPTLPLSPNSPWSCGKAYANVDKSTMRPDSSFAITRWLDSATDTQVDLLKFFAQPGSYSVMVAVDSFVSDPASSPRGYVDEGDQGETNNVSQAVTFTVDQVGRAIYLPIVRRG
jgi:hypothetical protein